jgi:hypothetical protein
MGLRALVGGCVALLASTAACAEVAGVDFGGASLRNDTKNPQSASISCDQSCAELGFECGAQFDPCGKPRDCGTCTDGRACNGGKCGCVKKSCAELGVACGTTSDGCGGVIECGGCVNPSEACVEGKCKCQPKTCTEQGAACGEVPDGCGAQYACGGCSDPANPVCGGAGPNKCGATACVPKTCVELQKNCGTVSDGCGGVLDCGACTDPAKCGGTGTVNVCGCTPTTCAMQGKNCGTIPNGCGGALNCGGCTAPESCQGAGVANVCGCTSNGTCSTNCGTGVDNCNRPCTRNLCGGGGGGCFARGTMVRLADGTSRAIETIEVGDLIASFDHGTNTMKAARVLATPVHGPESSANGFVVVHRATGTLRVTPNHPIVIDGVPTRAESLRTGSHVFGPGKPRNTPATLAKDVLDLGVRTEVIDQVELEPGNGESTYDLQVEGGGGFFAVGILVQQKRIP